jgi:hypothetical protein
MKAILAAILIAVSSAFAETNGFSLKQVESFSRRDDYLKNYTEQQCYELMANVIACQLRAEVNKDVPLFMEYHEWLYAIHNRLQDFRVDRKQSWYHLLVLPSNPLGIIEPNAQLRREFANHGMWNP